MASGGLYDASMRWVHVLFEILHPTAYSIVNAHITYTVHSISTVGTIITQPGSLLDETTPIMI